jgi:hypothetical protein
VTGPGARRVQAQVALGDAARDALLVHLGEANEQVGVRVVAGVRELDQRRAHDLEILGEGRTGEGEDVGTPGELGVVDPARRSSARPAARGWRPDGIPEAETLFSFTESHDIVGVAIAEDDRNERTR